MYREGGDCRLCIRILVICVSQFGWEPINGKGLHYSGDYTQKIIDSEADKKRSQSSSLWPFIRVPMCLRVGRSVGDRIEIY